MIPTITAFENSPDKGEGQARDMRVRWALEELGQPYDVRLVSMEALKQPAHRAIHPFGKIPTYQEGDLALFESGAIVLHLAERHRGLLSEQADARSRAIVWLFAALNTVEPPIVEREAFMILERDKPYYEARLPLLDDRVRERLGELSAHLGAADWLDGDFSVGDLMMVMVLFRLEDGGQALLDAYPNLSAYLARAKERPAFKRAFAAQREVFERLLEERRRAAGPG